MKLLLYLTVVLGPLLWVAGAFEVRRQRRLGRHGVRTTGTVVRYDRRSTDEGGHVHYAVVVFTDTTGHQHECRSASSGRRKWPIGRSVPVVYLPKAPHQASIDLRSQRVSGALVAFLAGSGLFAVGLFELLRG
ncbi:DUF3592 domain-containing protein [Streptomyces sp. PTM05]|uniref:DUF3592 domain-containing protein n=1 Tax=Streptantibioticus parmotrematis TaxID=2873249 RepID=A0ABS7QUR8_9ACTN|nr:DUF3592 domain-containing protein [Streptantibioticus parmotrematis]MBY8886963.1 DUF3592 domain-containing protein [Streptantibioticus parmotrematis]